MQEAIAAGKAGGAAAKGAPARPPSRTASGVGAASPGAGSSGSRPGTARSSPKALAPKNLNRLGSGATAAAKTGAGGAAPRRPAAQAGMTTRSRAAGGGGGGGAAAEEDMSVGKLSNEELEERMVQTFGEPTGGAGWAGLGALGHASPAAQEPCGRRGHAGLQRLSNAASTGPASCLPSLALSVARPILAWLPGGDHSAACAPACCCLQWSCCAAPSGRSVWRPWAACSAWCRRWATPAPAATSSCSAWPTCRAGATRTSRQGRVRVFFECLMSRPWVHSLLLAHTALSWLKSSLRFCCLVVPALLPVVP